MFAKIRQGSLTLAVFLSLFVSQNASAESALSVSPIYADISAKNRVQTITLYNDSDFPVVLQTEAFKWSQNSTKDGEDVITPTRDVLVSPPIIRVPKRSKQKFRVGLRRAPDRQKELTYRVYFRQVSASPSVGAGVSMMMRIGIPIFVKPLRTNVKRSIKQYVDFSVSSAVHRDGRPGYRVTIKNDMDMVFRAKQISIKQNNRDIITNASFTRVLPGVTLSKFIPSSVTMYRGAQAQLYLKNQGAKELGPFPVRFKY